MAGVFLLGGCAVVDEFTTSAGNFGEEIGKSWDKMPWNDEEGGAGRGSAPKEGPTDAEAQYKLGLQYSGNDDKNNFATANKWFRRAADQGHDGAQFMLGSNYLVGRGVGQDEEAAVHWLEKAAHQGHDRAMYLLGDVYYNGRGIGKDYAWGAMWFGKAAERGHQEATMALGLAFAVGRGAEKNRPLAWAWLKRAETLDHPDAERALDAIEENMSGEERETAEAYRDAIRATPRRGFYEDIPMVRYVQYSLTRLGYRPGAQDGLMGATTRQALAAYKGRERIAASPEIGDDLLAALRRSVSS